ncbi:geraniol 8-hydroxylase-like [Salvia miltiorrhiza]|uniref:geraniol 8-hydroxylase-like n=1 Tax=Salvia miltiorrhiza TaxID=226208 RepID=UPI0025ABC393|nr:geraniol 8-hydroxylase-like [Salvia miltiorrhiza]
MDFLTSAVGLLLALILYHGIKTLILRGKNLPLPPGPTPVPLIGNLHLLGDHPHKSLARLANIHGPLMRLRLGFVNTIVVSSADVAKQVLQKHDLAFSSRTVPNALHAHDHFKYSVAWLPVASQWRTLRKVMNSNIFSASCLDANEHLRSRKVDELIEYCRTAGAVDVGRAAFRTTLNSLSNTTFSIDLTDPFSDSAKEFKQLVSGIMEEAGKPNLVDFFPFLARLDPQGIRRRMTVYFGKVIDLFSSLIDQKLEKRKCRDQEETSDDVIDTLLDMMPQEIDRTHIERMCLDLFAAGTDTTSSTIEWAMAEALRNPEIMKRAKAELEEVIGKGETVREGDISRLPYLRCMVKETMRLHPPVPFLIPRRVERDVEVMGHMVPKDSQVLVNVWAIGRDPGVWEEPLEFNPHRFMESEVDVRGRNFELIPFGAGRRICPGLPLAMRMVPVMLGSLLNSFDWKVEGEKVEMDDKFGITLAKAQSLRAVPIPL